MNYIKFNNIDSRIIKGLIISELPPISKPKMKIQETTIDGVDGSIIEELGYESYDKSLKIGLARDFDIDEIIKYFSGKGTMVFSNEPDKYYNVNILEQIDYVRLLRFRTADIKMRVQPFKYEYEEEPTMAEGNVIEGSNIQITDGKVTKLQIDGKCEQDGEPTPDNPQEIEVVEGYNLLKITTFTNGLKEQIKNGVTATINDDGTITCKGSATDAITIYLTKNDLDFTLGDGCFLCNSPSANQRVEFVCSVDGTEKYLNSYGTGNFINAKTSFIFKSAYIIIAKGEEVDITFTPMFTKGTTQKPYLPYDCVGVKVNGKNLGCTYNNLGMYQTVEGQIGTFASGSSYLGAYCKVEAGNTYSISKNKLTSRFAVGVTKEIPSENTECLAITRNDSAYKLENITIPNGYSYIVLYLSNSSETSTGLNLQIEKGTTTTSYEPYQEQIVPLDLKGNTLAKINDDIKDELVIKDGKLKIIKRVGRVVLNGSESWYAQDRELTNSWRYYTNNIISNSVPNVALSDKFISVTASVLNDTDTEALCRINGKQIAIRLNKTRATTLAEFKTWLSNNNVTVYYQLAEPQIIELGTLEEHITTFEGVSNISNSANANMIIDYIDNKLIVNNIGNYTSKPIIELEGAGIVEFILNGNKLFRYTFQEGENSVVIDSQKQDAYLGTILKNRNMNGEFPELKVGENIITWEGTISNIKISSKSRWL